MGRAWILVAAAVALCAGDVLAEPPSGFISSDRWAVLAPLEGLDCTAGGTRSMLESWIGPQEPSRQNPVLGTEWDLPREHPRIWLGTDHAMFEAIQPGADPDLVDIGAHLSGKGLSKDFTVAVAATYVSNETRDPLPVGLCTSSDDSIQVWVNDALALNLSVCREATPGCAEITPTVLAPGTNRILVLLWNGVERFGFRLGLARPDGTLHTGDGGDDVRFLGAASSDGAEGSLPTIWRSAPGAEIYRPDASHDVLLHGEGFDEDSSFSVVEELRGPILAEAITNVSSCGVVDTIDVATQPVGRFDDSKDWFHETVVGTPCSSFNGTTFAEEPDGGGKFTSHATTGSDVWTEGDAFEFAFKYVTGDFDMTIEILEKESWNGPWARFGLMVRQSLDFNSKFTAIEDHGPSIEGPRRNAWCTSRTTHHDTSSIVCGPKDKPLGPGLEHPRFLRIVRSGGNITTFVSNDPACAREAQDGADPCPWTSVCPDDGWTKGPDAVFVGFFLATSRIRGCTGETMDWRLVSFSSHGDNFGIPPAGARITWNVNGYELAGQGLSYTLSAIPGSVVRAFGHAEGSPIQGEEVFTFQAPPGEPTAVFEASHDIGVNGPCMPGSLEVDDGGTEEDPRDDMDTLKVWGGNVSNGTDQLFWAYSAVRGDFDARVSIFEVVPSPQSLAAGRFGLMARWDASPGAANFFVFDTAMHSRCDIEGPGTSVRTSSGASETYQPAAMWWQDVFGAQWLDPKEHCWPPNPDPRQGDLRGDDRNIAPWLRLVRRGDTFYGYASAEGDAWRTLGSFSWPGAPCEMLVGVAGASRYDCEPLEVVFREFSLGLPRPIETSAAGVDRLESSPVLEQDDFDGEEPGRCPAGWLCNRWGEGDFHPQVTKDGRLRLGDMQDGDLGGGRDVATTAFLERVFRAGGVYLIDFDAFFAFDPALAGGEEAPGDGLTLCVLGTVTGTDALCLRLGDRGGGLGYGRIQLSQDEPRGRTRDFSVGSFAVELDCRHDDEPIGDGDGANTTGASVPGKPGQPAASYHVGLDVNGAVSSVQRNLHLGVRDEELPDVFDPMGVHVRVLYDGGRVKAWISSDASRGAEPLLVLDHEIEPLDSTAPSVLIGFTAATGSSTCVMEVDNVVVRDARLPTFHRGDVDGDGKIELTDAVRILAFLFLDSGPIGCMDAADADDNDVLEITDAVRILGYLFLGYSAPAAPGPPPEPCGEDTGGSLGCADYSSCRGD